MDRVLKDIHQPSFPMMAIFDCFWVFFTNIVCKGCFFFIIIIFHKIVPFYLVLVQMPMDAMCLFDYMLIRQFLAPNHYFGAQPVKAKMSVC